MQDLLMFLLLGLTLFTAGCVVGYGRGMDKITKLKIECNRLYGVGQDICEELETLKKATDAFSAERAGKMADEMETGRRISTTRHIRELRAYVEILEGKSD